MSANTFNAFYIKGKLGSDPGMNEHRTCATFTLLHERHYWRDGAPVAKPKIVPVPIRCLGQRMVDDASMLVKGQIVVIRGHFDANERRSRPELELVADEITETLEELR